MRLKEVNIENFRSIKSQTLKFDTNCRILVGINESGKSNVLKALNLLSDEPVKQSDNRAELDDENNSTGYVRFVFNLDDADREQIFSEIQEGILTNKPSNLVLSNTDSTLTLKKVCNSLTEGLFQIDLSNGEKSARYWTRIFNSAVPKNLLKPPKANPIATALFTITSSDDEAHTISDFKIIDKSFVKGPGVAVLTELTTEDLRQIIGNKIMELVHQQLPKCIYWSYDEKYLLPSQINLDTFLSNPDTCVPLKNMFEMAEIDDIPTAFDAARKRSAQGEWNLLGRVSREATKHMHSIWPEYRDIEILLEPYGPDTISASIKDTTNRFDFAHRSDGFKRFISFLLIISAQVKSRNLQNTLILIDEPEIGLHPKGAKYLLDEIIKISQDNYVVFSTHSIFMIDRNNIDRHIIVQKKGEITTLKNADNSNFQDEEVLYNALGYSAFEMLNEQNLLFEGWKDKHLFQVAMNRLPAKHKNLKAKFKDIGIATSPHVE